MTDAVLSQHQGAIASITLNRSERLNTINRDLIEGLNAAITAAEDDPVRNAG